jgi:hypothetical protein
MARDITVTFDDGSSHVYNNAPDDITFDKALARAQSEFKDRAITNIDGGRKAAEKPVAAPAAFTGTSKKSDFDTDAIDDYISPPLAEERGPNEKFVDWANRTGAFNKAPFDPVLANQLSKRAYVKALEADTERRVAAGSQLRTIAKDARQRLRDAAANEDYGFLDFAQDSGLDLAKGTVGLGQSYVGLLNLTTGGAASRVLGQMGYNPDKTNEFLNGFQSITRQNARLNVEEAKGFLDTLSALMVNPTELIGQIVESLPGTVAAGAQGGAFARFLIEKAAAEATAKKLTGEAATAFIKDRVTEQAGKIAYAASAGEGTQTAGSIAEQAGRGGRDWQNYVLPALGAGLGTTAIGVLSGKLAAKAGIGDVETDIATQAGAKAAGISGLEGIGVSKGNTLRRIFTEAGKEGFLEELPQAAQEQIFTNVATGRPWDEGVGKAAAQGLGAGAGMGGGHAVISRALEKLQNYVSRKEDAAIAGLDQEAATRDEHVSDLTQRLVDKGYTPDDAYQIAEEEIGKIYERKNQPTQGAPSVTTTVPPTGGAGVSVADESGRREPTGGLDFLEPTGVVPTRQDATGAPAGETVEPTPVTPLHKYIIDRTIDKFYDQLINTKYEDLPENLQSARLYLDGINDSINQFREWLSNWDHPAITGATDHDKRLGKARSTAEESELLAIESRLAAHGHRITNQAMALAKGYKGKKAGSEEKIHADYDNAITIFERGLELANKYGLLPADVAKTYEEGLKEKKISEADKLTKQWDELERSTKDELPPAQTEEPPQQVPVDKPAPLTDNVDPETPTDSTTPKAIDEKPYFGSEEINALGDKIKTAIDKLTNDFMVGDMVRYGATQGTVVGVDNTHVKIHPDGAASPKAYYRILKNKVELIARPDTTSKTAAMAMPGEDKKFGIEQGKLNADMAGLVQLLGANMYASAIAEVAVKELLQNSFDAVKGAVSNKKSPSLYEHGEITITINDADRTITIQDNARGMTPEIVRDAFFTVAGSDKSDLTPEERSGGLGLAKMGFMMGAERLTLDTVRDGVRVRVDTTATDIANSNFQIIKTSANKKEHGTTVTVKIPEFYTDPKTGEEKAIYFSGNPSYYSALQKPLIGPVVVKTIRKSTFKDNVETLPVGLNFAADKYIPFKVNFSWGSADIYFGKERGSDEYSVNHQVLSSGVYQFNTKFMLSQTEKIPYDIIVNVKPSVEAKHPDYPFENSRERFKGRLEEDIKSLGNYLAQIARGNQMEDLKENFKNIVSMPRVDVGQDITDITEKIHKAFDNRGKTERRELPPMPTAVRVEGTRVISVDTGKVIADRAKEEEKQTKGSFTADTAAPEKNEFLLTMQQSPNLPIFHNNTNVDFLAVGKQYGNPERFFAELGTLMVEMKESLANSGIYGYDVLKPENLFFGGVSIDKGYGGVHIKVPYQAVLINPFYDFGAKTLFGARRFSLTTMIHEIAHTGDMSHGVGHNAQMVRVEQYLEDEGLYDYFQDAILEVLTKHESTFTAMREAYGNATTKNTAKSLKDYEKGSASESVGRDSGSSEDELRAISAGREQGGDGNIRPAPPINPTSGIPRSTGSTSPNSVKGLQQDVVDAINRNDVSGALRALARNTSGLYAELAQRLADLNLPTNIIFNNQRALVRQIIDDRSAQHQIRLFAYLSRFAPEFYEKYFKDYDKAENLERVAEGLSKIDSSGINTKPVNVELAIVQQAYDKNMEGLSAPGFYTPDMDTINIRPDDKFGSSNRVLLHEVVHAATEYVLRNTQGLTQDQQDAVSDLHDMYRLAQTKLDPKEYGFTNIFEFVAEAMTNPKFQAKLKGIPYTPEKTSMLNSLARFIARAFGINNVAGASMVAINEIFSAHRPSNIKTGPLRFATSGPKKKRVRGPISKPDVWRTAEDVQTTLKDDITSAATGGIKLEDALERLLGPMISSKVTHAREVMLPVLGLRQLKDIVRRKIPEFTAAVNILEKMNSYRGSLIKIAEDIVQHGLRLQSEYPRQMSLMSRIMIEATIRARDPDKGVPSGGQPDALDKAWDTLRPEFKQLYRDTREFYANSVKDMIRTMKQRALGKPKAERQAILRKINEQFGPDKLVAPYFPLRRFGDYWFQVGEREFKEFYTFESASDRDRAFNARQAKLQAGNKQQQKLVDTMRMGNGISELYSQNIATTQVLRDVEDMINTLTATDVAGVKAEIKDSLNQLVYILLPQQSMRKMFINRKAIQGASSDMLRVFAHTAVHSAYQQTRFKFAEPFVSNIDNAKKSIDLMQIHEKLITPQQAAVYRDYVNELEKRTKIILGVEDKSFLAKATGNITGTVFFFMLSGPATAIVNNIGMAMLTMPYIGARYGYVKTNAALLKNLGRYAGSIPKRSLVPLATGNVSQVSFPSIVEGWPLDPLMQRAANRFVNDGDINISMTNDAFDLGDMPSAMYTGTANLVKKFLAGVFHQSERFNRESTLLTVFELAYEKFLKEPKRDVRGIIERRAGQPIQHTPDEAFELAIQEARDIAGLTLGDFIRQMKGRIFTVPGVNVITQFKQYAITTSYLLFRTVYESLGRAYTNKEVQVLREKLIRDNVPPADVDRMIAEANDLRKLLYKEAWARAAGIMGMAYLFGGAPAQPFFSSLGLIVRMFRPDDDDDELWDWENFFLNRMIVDVGGAAAAIFTKMGMDSVQSQEAGRKFGEALARGPVSALTGTALSDRVSLDLKNLWWREGRYSPNARQSIMEEAIANLGPAFGLSLNWAEAYQLAGEGKFERAFEKAVPSMFSNMAGAYRLSKEGATNRNGVVIGHLYADQFTTWDLAMRSVGFTPEKLALAQKAAFQVQTMNQKVKDHRNALLNRLWMERGGPGFEDALAKANEFSLRFPEYAIDGELIRESFKDRAEEKGRAEAIGAKIDKKLLGRLEPKIRYGVK